MFLAFKREADGNSSIGKLREDGASLIGGNQPGGGVRFSKRSFHEAKRWHFDKLPRCIMYPPLGSPSARISNRVAVAGKLHKVAQHTVWKKRNGIFDPDWPMIYHRLHDDGNRSRSSCTCHIKSFHLRKVAYPRGWLRGNVIRIHELVSRVNTFFITCLRPNLD